MIKMNTYLSSIKIAVYAFPIIAFILLVPFLIFQYRKYGYINKLRSFILYSLLFYVLAAYCLIILPLPEVMDTCSIQNPNAQHTQLIPFQFVKEFMKETQVSLTKPATYWLIFKERAFLQVAFNFLLLLPLGVYLRYYFKRGWLQTTLITLAVSLFFEITQLTALYGFFTCPYRLFDIDDLLLNTSGGLCGYLIAPLFTYFLPKANELDAHIDLSKYNVGYVRRLLAFWIDWLIVNFILSVIYPGLGGRIIVLGVVVFGYFIMTPYVTNGLTFGKWLLRIRLKGAGDRITIKELSVRYGILYFGLGGMNYLLTVNNLQYELYWAIFLLLSIITFLSNALFAIHLIRQMFRKDKRLFYENISGTYQVVLLKEKEKL